MQDRNVGQRFRAAGDRDVDVAERDLVGGVGDRLVCRRAGAAHGERLHAFRQQRHQRDFARDVRREDRWNDRSEDERLDFAAVEIRALDQLGDAELAEVDRGDGLERGSRSCERRPNPGDDRDAAAIAKRCHGGNLAKPASSCRHDA